MEMSSSTVVNRFRNTGRIPNHGSHSNRQSADRMANEYHGCECLPRRTAYLASTRESLGSSDFGDHNFLI